MPGIISAVIVDDAMEKEIPGLGDAMRKSSSLNASLNRKPLVFDHGETGETYTMRLGKNGRTPLGLRIEIIRDRDAKIELHADIDFESDVRKHHKPIGAYADWIRRNRDCADLVDALVDSDVVINGGFAMPVFANPLQAGLDSQITASNDVYLQLDLLMKVMFAEETHTVAYDAWEKEYFENQKLNDIYRERSEFWSEQCEKAEARARQFEKDFKDGGLVSELRTQLITSETKVMLQKAEIEGLESRLKRSQEMTGSHNHPATPDSQPDQTTGAAPANELQFIFRGPASGKVSPPTQSNPESDPIEALFQQAKPGSHLN